MKKLSVGTAFLFVALAAGSAHGAPIFVADFDNEVSNSAPYVASDFNGFSQFDVADGTVDLVVGFHNGAGVACPGNTGGCVDLDGSSGNAGIMTSKAAISFQPGFDYMLSLVLSGSRRGSATETDTVEIRILNGILATQSVTKAPSEGYETYSYAFTVASNTSGQIQIENLGGDNIGLLLDSVTLTEVASSTAVPLPATLPLLAAGLGLLGYAGRRKKAASL